MFKLCDKKWFDNFKLKHFIMDEILCIKWVDWKFSKVFLDRWMDGWIDVKAVLRIAYSNKKVICLWPTGLCFQRISVPILSGTIFVVRKDSSRVAFESWSCRPLTQGLKHGTVQCHALALRLHHTVPDEVGSCIKSQKLLWF
jgi:hypothetical protein